MSLSSVIKLPQSDLGFISYQALLTTLKTALSTLKRPCYPVTQQMIGKGANYAKHFCRYRIIIDFCPQGASD